MAMATTYDVNQRFPVEKIRKILGIKELPILAAISQGAPIKNTRAEWYDDEIIGLLANVVGPVDSSSGKILASTTTLDVSTANVFSPGDVVEWESERLKVTAVDYDNSKITVIRGYQGTTAADHDPNKTAEVISTVVPEGGRAAGSKASTPIKYFNVTQVFQEYLDISGTLDAVEPEWANSERERLLRQKLFRLDSLRAKSIWYGIRYDSASEKERTFGGVDFFVANKIDAGGSSLTPDLLTQVINQAADDGVFDIGLEYQIWLNPIYELVINKWYQDQLFIDRKENKYGQVINYLVTGHGTFPFKFDRNIKVGEIFLIDAKQIKKRTLRPEQRIKLAQTADNKEFLIVEEFTIEVLYPSAWRKIENVATP